MDQPRTQALFCWRAKRARVHGEEFLPTIPCVKTRKTPGYEAACGQRFFQCKFLAAVKFCEPQLFRLSNPVNNQKDGVEVLHHFLTDCA